MSPLATVQSVLARPVMSAGFFVSGVLYDTLTLTRIDRLQDNLILLFYLVLLGFLVVLTGRHSMATVEPAALEPHDSSISRFLIKAKPYYPKAMQFLFGGLFSAYAVFYSRSATLTGTGVFLGLLVLLLMANEFLRDRLLNVRLLVALFALASFSFFTFFLPVMVGTIGTWVFLLGAALSVGVTLLVVQMIYRRSQERSQKKVVSVGGPAIAFIGLLIGFYFLNWIPPVPLSMKFGGMYREVQKQDDRFVLSFDREWYQVWKRSQNPFPANEPVYCFTAVFAPVALNTTVYHHWYFRTNSDKPFIHADRIPIKIAGGREGGCRAYTFKQWLDPGDWRVDVETEDGRVVGRVSAVVAQQKATGATARTLLY
jgi:MFS family permease